MSRWFARRRRWTRLVWLSLLATAAAGPLLFSAGFLNTRGGGDSPFLLFRLHQLVSALADGHFPVRWMPDAAYGLGYPFFNYYAALPFYLGAGLVALGFGLIAAVKTTQWLGFLLAAVSVWGLVDHFMRHDSEGRDAGSRWAPWLAAVAYTFVPYHLVNIYVRGDSLTEFWAMGFYPLVLWMAARLSERPGRGRVAALALSYGALILTHNISALLFTPLLLLFCCLLVLRRGRATGDWGIGNWGTLAAGLTLGLVLAAFYWLPALGEQDAVQLGAQTTGYFHYANHFRVVGGDGIPLVQPRLVFNYDIAVGTPFAMGAVQAALALVGAVAALVRWRRWRHTDWVLPLFALLVLVIATGMMMPISRPLWEGLPLLPLVQFPWRFLALQALAVALLAAELAGSRRVWSWLGAGLVAAVALSSLVGLRPNTIALTSADVTPERLQLYEWFSGNIGTTIRYEYLPSAVVPRLYTSEAVLTGHPMTARFLSGEGRAEVVIARTGSQEWAVEVVSSTATVTFPTLYWPGWRAEVDGRPEPLRAAESTGTMTLDLSAGQHSVGFVLGRTPLRLWAEALSSLGLLACLALGVDRSPRGVMRRAWRPALGALVFCLLLALILHSIPAPAGTDDDLTWDFAQEAYLHPSPDGVAFGETAVMTGYQIDQEGGDAPLEVLVAWETGVAPGLEAELALVHPAEVVHNIPYVVATDRQPLVSGQMRFALRPTAAAPPGPLLPRLRVLDPSGGSIPALTATGETRGDLYLRPVWPETPLQPGDGIGVEFDTAEAESLSPEILAVTLRWTVGQPLPANYGLSLRLRDAAGVEWAALDKWPGYGYYPTSLWEAGTIFEERFFLAVPYGLPPGPYILTASLYEADTLISRWGPFERPLTVDVVAPYDGRPLSHRFDAGLAIAELAVPEALDQGDPLVFGAEWVTEVESSEPVQGNWELVDPAGELVSLQGLELGPWPADAVVLGRYLIALDPSTPAGSYALCLRLGEEAPWVAATVTVRERARRFNLPEMETGLGVLFGDAIELAGYDLARGDDALELTLYWRAQQAVPADLIVFVHLYDPATEAIPVQSDVMPRAGAYPTSRWAPGEVVDDRVTLSLADVPPGEYQLAVGLYSIAGDRYTRMPAVDGTGEPLPDDRAVLPAVVTVP